MARDAADYQFWRQALRGVKNAVHEGFPQCGFYKLRFKRDGQYLPIAFWRNPAGEIVCGFQGKLVDAVEHWTWAAKNPVEETTYRFAVESGRWPDEPEPTATPMGHNLPEDPFESLKLRIDDKLEQAEIFLAKAPKAPSENDANLARNVQAQLLALNKEADALFETEKRPLVDAGRTVDKKFSFRKAVADVAVRLRSVFEAFMKAEEARQRAEAQKKFEEDRKRAEEARKAAEDERKRLEREDPIMAHVSEPEPLPELPLAPETVKITVGGGFGRKTGLKTDWVPVIEDYRAALAHFAEYAEVRAAVEALVKKETRTHKAQTKIPGVKVIEDRRAA